MNKKITPKLYAALVCFIALEPLYLLAASALIPSRWWLAIVLPLPTLLLTGLTGLLPAKRRTLALILSIAIMAAMCTLLFLENLLPGIVLFVLCVFQMLLFLPAMARPAHEEWSMRLLSAGLAVHIGAQFVKDLPLFTHAAALLTWAFVIYLFMLLFSFNRMTLAATGSTTGKTLLRHNRRLLTVLSLLILLLTNIRGIGQAIRRAIAWVIVQITALLAWFGSLLPQQDPGGGAQESLPLEGLMEEATEPNVFSQIMDVVLIVFGVLVAAVLVFFVGKQLIKLLRKAFRALADRLRLFKQRITADYEDQSETLLDWSEVKTAAVKRMQRIRNRLRPTSWEALAPDQRVRRVYRLLLRHIDNPDPALTAQEVLQSGALPLPGDAVPTAAALYDRARYSTHPIAPKEADELRRQAGV